MSAFHKLWAAWSVGFIVLEAVALYRQRSGCADSFCAFFRKVTGIVPARKTKKLVCVALGVFLAWFYVHIVTGRI